MIQTSTSPSFLLLSSRGNQPIAMLATMAVVQSMFTSQSYSIRPSQSTFITTYYSDSPYPEVRAAVSNVDDPLMPVNTFRMWFLGILFSLLSSGLNQVLRMRCMSLFHFRKISSHLYLSRSFHICYPCYCPACVFSSWPRTCSCPPCQMLQHFWLYLVPQPRPIFNKGTCLYYNHVQ